MSRTEQYLNAYEEEAHNVALNNQNVYVRQILYFMCITPASFCFLRKGQDYIKLKM